MSVDSETLDAWWSGQLLQEIKQFYLYDPLNDDETGLFVSLWYSKSCFLLRLLGLCGTKSRQWISLPLHVVLKVVINYHYLWLANVKVLVILRMLKKLPTKCDANTNFCMNIVVFEVYLGQLDRKMNAKNKRKPVLCWSVWCTHKEHNISDCS